MYSQLLQRKAKITLSLQLLYCWLDAGLEMGRVHFYAMSPKTIAKILPAFNFCRSLGYNLAFDEGCKNFNNIFQGYLLSSST